jgi:hypothetical protein
MSVTVKMASVTYGRKFNLGDYNSATIDCTLWADVSDDQPLDEAMTALWTMAKENVRAQALPLVQKAKDKKQAEVKQIFMGLPLELQTAAVIEALRLKSADEDSSDDDEDDYNPDDGMGHMPYEFGDQ